MNLTLLDPLKDRRTLIFDPTSLLCHWPGQTHTFPLTTLLTSGWSLLTPLSVPVPTLAGTKLDRPPPVWRPKFYGYDYDPHPWVVTGLPKKP